MSIRLKFLLALLLAVLLPTAFAAVLGYRSSVVMARTLAADQREGLLREAQGVQLAVIRKNVGITEQQMMVFYAATEVQRIEAARALASPDAGLAERLPISAFREGGSAPGLARSAAHVVVGDGGPPGPALVTRERPAIYVAPEGSAEDADRLAGVGDSLRALAPALQRSAFWQFLTLDSGVHLVYPGHGLLPDDYDAREGAVYRRSRPTAGRGYGSPPSVDPATGQTLVGMIGPVTDAAGEIIGITGVLSRVDEVLRGLAFGTRWGEDAENYFVAVEPDERGEPRLYIIAKRSYAEAGRGQTGFLGVDAFETDDPEDAGVVLEAFGEGESGTMVVRIGGREMLCAYAGFAQDSVGLISLVPVSSIGAIADEAGARVRARARTQLVGVLVGLGAFGAGMAFAVYLGAGVFTRPILDLVEAMRRVAGGDLEVRAEPTSRDEVGELAVAFNAMVPRLRDHLRMRSSLDLAHQVQRGLLPSGPPEVPGLEVAGLSVYCDETGGDYYDFVDFDQPSPGRLTVAVGDVTGHGVAAALLMATARALIRMRATLPGELGERLADINRHLAHDADVGRFMTLMLLSIDRPSLTARWVGAGHDPVLVYDAGRDEFSELAGEDIPLGLEAGWEFCERTTDTLREGQVLLIGTDGIWETMNGRDEQYGKPRLRACLRSHAGEPAEAIARAVLGELREFRAGAAQLDDVTMVVVKITPAA